MNVRGTYLCLLCVGAVFVACGSKSRQPAEVAGQADTVHVVGDDKDKHGCIASAGYTWSEAQKDCIRLWEKGVRMNAVDDAEKMLFLVFSPDSTQVELFFSEEEMPNEILERRGLPAVGYGWNGEDDDRMNVRLEDGIWSVCQSGRIIQWVAVEAAGM